MTAEIVKSAAAWKNAENEKEERGLSYAMMSHIVSCVDLLSANYFGVPAAAAQNGAKFQLLTRLHATLTTEFYDYRASSS